MSTEIVVNFEQLRGAAADCRSTVNTMTSTLDNLNAQLQPLVATWEGEAQSAYTARQAEWNTAASDLRDLLTAIAAACDASAEIMQAGENRNTNRFA